MNMVIDGYVGKENEEMFAKAATRGTLLFVFLVGGFLLFTLPKKHQEEVRPQLLNQVASVANSDRSLTLSGTEMDEIYRTLGYKYNALNPNPKKLSNSDLRRYLTIKSIQSRTKLDKLYGEIAITGNKNEDGILSGTEIDDIYTILGLKYNPLYPRLLSSSDLERYLAIRDSVEKISELER